MNRYPIIFLAFFFIQIKSLIAQNLIFGRYSSSELEINEVEYQPEADAVVLGEISSNRVDIGGVESKIHRRMKVLKPEGFDVANVNIRYYAPSVTVSKIRAQIMNLENGHQKLTSVKEAEMYTVDIGDGLKEVRFTFPNVQVGSIIEYEYTTTDRRITILQPWVFQNYIPTLLSVYSIEIGGSLNYRMLSQGPQATKYQFGVRKDGIYQWILTNLRAIEREPFMSNYQDYLEKVEFQLSGYGFRGSNNVFADWNDLADHILNMEQLRTYIKPSKAMTEKLVEVDSPGGSQLEKAKHLYNYVMDNFKFDGSIGFIPDEVLKEIMDKKSGSRASVNCLLMAYLLKNGIETHPLLISSKGNGRSNIIDSPFADQFNNLILVVKADEKVYFVDATNKDIPFGYLPLNFHVSTGFIMNPKMSGLVPISLPHRSGINQSINIKYDGDDQLITDVVVRFLDYDAIPVATNAREMKEEEFKEKYFQIAEETIQEFTISTKSEPRKTFDAKLKKEVSGFGGELLYLKPFQYNRWLESPFKSESRTFPIDFEHSFVDNFTSVIEIPEGYELDDYPEEVSLSLPGNIFVFNYKISTLDGMVKINSTLELKSTIIQPEIYKELKYFLETLSSKLQEPVILRKVL
jgi:hypothetical protein